MAAMRRDDESIEDQNRKRKESLAFENPIERRWVTYNMIAENVEALENMFGHINTNKILMQETVFFVLQNDNT